MPRVSPELREAAARDSHWSAIRAADPTIVAGVIDSALSSLATFACGLFAVRSLELASLGGYSFVFAAAALAMIMPDSSTFATLEVMAVAYPKPERLRLLASTLRLGALPALLPALAVSSCTLLMPGGVPQNTVIALTVTAVAYAFLSPVQDHLRRMLHVADASWLAAAVSTLHLTVVAAAILLFIHLQVGAAWSPFGALAVGNLVSLLFGIRLARRYAGADSIRLPVRWRDVFRSGRWLMLSGLAPNGAALVASAIVGHVAGIATLGYAEAARIAGQPLLVLSIGLSATVGPRVVAAVQQRRPSDARRGSGVFIALVVVSGLMYLAICGESWPWNPVRWALPKAYLIPGLVSLTIVANIFTAAASPGRSELLGAGRTRALARVEIGGNALRILIAFAARTLGAFVVPAGLLAVGVVRVLWYGRVAAAHWRTVQPALRESCLPAMLHKDFPPSWGHLKIPVSSREDALTSLSLFAGCRPNALRAQRVAAVAIKCFGPRILPGRAVHWMPVDPETWSEIVPLMRARFGDFDTVAGYERYQPGRGGPALLLIRAGRAVAFVKLRQGDGGALEHERRALEAVWHARPRSFIVPEPLAWGQLREWHYFAMAPVPPGMHGVPDDPPLAAIASDISDALSTLPQPPGTPAWWRPMHGDLTPWNLRQISRSLFLFDWERAAWGPPAADEVFYAAAAAALGRKAPPLPADALEAIDFWQQRMHARHERRRDQRLDACFRRVLGEMRVRATRASTVPV